MEDEEIIEKIRNSLENKIGLDIKDGYFLTKKLSDIYLDEIYNEGEETLDEGEEEDILDDNEDKGSEMAGGEEPEDELDHFIESDDEGEEPEETKTPISAKVQVIKKPLIKRPMIKIKK